MPSELLLLTRQVYQSIHPSLLIQPSENAEQLQAILRLSADIQPALIEQYCAATSASQQMVIVQSAQSCAVHLADKLQQYIDEVEMLPLPTKAQHSLLGFYHLLQAQLLELLYFLQEYYSDQCNTNQRMPVACLIRLKQSVQQWCISLQAWAADVQPSLAVLLVQLLSTDNKPGISYHRYAYWNELYNVLRSAHADEWVKILIRHNFNDAGFVNLVIKNMERELSDLNLPDAIAEWARHYMEIIRTADDSAMAFHPGQPSCRQQLQAVIKAEIAVLQNTTRHKSDSSAAHDDNSPKPFQTSLTVTQLAGMVRLLVDSGIVTCNNQSALLKNITNCFATRNGQSFSSGSLRQKYYHQDIASVSILKTHLSNMMTQLRNF